MINAVAALSRHDVFMVPPAMYKCYKFAVSHGPCEPRLCTRRAHHNGSQHSQPT
jgi:hypothetical protein